MYEISTYIERITVAKIKIFRADDSNHPKAKGAIPRRPGINFITE